MDIDGFTVSFVEEFGDLFSDCDDYDMESIQAVFNEELDLRAPEGIHWSWGEDGAHIFVDDSEWSEWYDQWDVGALIDLFMDTVDSIDIEVLVEVFSR